MTTSYKPRKNGYRIKSENESESKMSSVGGIKYCSDRFRRYNNVVWQTVADLLSGNWKWKLLLTYVLYFEVLPLASAVFLSCLLVKSL